MKKSGFTLIELSIVLVIIGLIIGGVLGGQELIRQAELQSITADFSRYSAALNTFRTKYDALAGDMKNASAYWPVAYNGDGDGHFGSFNGGDGPKMWQQLSLSGIVAGNYTGIQVSNPAGGVCDPGTACAKTRSGDLVYFPLTLNQAGTPPYNIGTRKPDGFLLYDGVGVDGSIGITPQEAASLDKKMDDGVPGKGNLYGIGTGGIYNGDGWSNCAVDATGAAYNLGNSAKQCRLFYVTK